MSTAPVFVVDELPVGSSTVLDGPQGRHAAAVRRMRVGESVTLTDGRGGLAQCTVRASDKHTVELNVDSRSVVAAADPRVVVVQALIKGDRGELAVETMTEAGVDRIVPWRAARSIAKWDSGPRGEKALARWRTTATEAAKQARRAWVPPVDEAFTTAGVLELVAAARSALVLHESAAVAMSDVEMPGSGEIVLVVGPEGGIDSGELEALTAAGAHVVRMGDTVLRASTAATVALGALGALTPRW